MTPVTLAPTSILRNKNKAILITASKSQSSKKRISWAEDVKDNNLKAKSNGLMKKGKANLSMAEKSNNSMESGKDSETDLSSEQLLTATGSLTLQKRKSKESNLEESSPLKKRRIWGKEDDSKDKTMQPINMPPMPCENAWPAKPEGPESVARMWKEPIAPNIGENLGELQDIDSDTSNMSDAGESECQGLEEDDIDLEPMYLPCINHNNIRPIEEGGFRS